MPKTNFVLIDFENIQHVNVDLIDDENFKILIFAGSNQNKISLDLAQKLQKFGPRLEWIRIEGTGPNALDFHIAFYLGDLSSKFSDAFFHIISKDKGFDPLIKSLKLKKSSAYAKNLLKQFR